MSALAEKEHLPAYLTGGSRLTPSQTKIVWHLAQGRDYSAIGRAEHIAWNTVRNHLANARELAGVATNEELVGLATRNGWI